MFMMNKEQLSVWNKKLLADHSVRFIDEEGDTTNYEVGGDHVGLASDIFSVDESLLQVFKDGKLIGKLEFANEYNERLGRAATEIYNYSMDVEHLANDFKASIE